MGFLRKRQHVTIGVETVCDAVAPIAVGERTQFRRARFDGAAVIEGCVFDEQVNLRPWNPASVRGVRKTVSEQAFDPRFGHESQHAGFGEGELGHARDVESRLAVEDAGIEFRAAGLVLDVEDEVGFGDGGCAHASLLGFISRV